MKRYLVPFLFALWIGEDGQLGACYAGGMNKLFNKTFFNFTLGFVCILLTSFLVAALISHFDAQQALPASVEQGSSQ